MSKQSSGEDCVDGPESIQTYDSVTSTTSKAFKQYKIEKFYKSIKSRLIVAEVIKRYKCYQNINSTFHCIDSLKGFNCRIEGGAEFSFDFVCLLVVAACLAFMGEDHNILSDLTS